MEEKKSTTKSISRQLIVGALLGGITAFGVISQNAQGAKNEKPKFTQSGDGDFKNLPVDAAPQVDLGENEVRVAVPEPEAPPAKAAVPLIEAPKAAKPAVAEAETTPMFGEEPPSKSTQSIQAAPVEEAPAAPTEKKTVAKPDKPAKAGKGKFAMTKGGCSMLRSPAADSEKHSALRADRKIWVVDRKDGFFSAFDKSGAEVYITAECLSFEK